MPGKLVTEMATKRADLLGQTVLSALTGWAADPSTAAGTVPAAEAVLVAPIDPELSDTAAFCEAYEVPPAVCANCVVVSGKREGVQRFGACLVLATTRADINGVVRRHLDVRKASFLPMAQAVELTGMEYGGITPIGLPPAWPLFIDAAVAATDSVVIGSGVRRSKLVLAGQALAALPGVVVLEGLGIPVAATA